MSQPTNPPEPDYVVCECRHCSGHIEFDALQFTPNNSVVPCPHCGTETKLYIPFLEAEKDSSQLTPSPTSLISVKHEGFSGGMPSIPKEDVRNPNPTITNPQYTDAQIKSIGKRENDEAAIRLFHEGDQETVMSFEDARRYVADPRFKLVDPETSLRFTPATLEVFIKSKRLQNKSKSDQQSPLSQRRKAVVLTKAQCETPLAKELIRLLLEIEKEGFSSDSSLRRLSNWLGANADSGLPTVSFLTEVTKDVLSCGCITLENKAKMQNAIVRVLPRSIQIAEINSEDFSEKLPARESVLKRIRERGGDPWPGITRAEAHAIEEKLPSKNMLDRIRELGGEPPNGITAAEAYELKEKLYHRPTEKQLEYIRALGVNPPPDLTRFTAIELIDKLLHSVKATEGQLQYIRDLGGNPSAELSHADAGEIIKQLLARQQPTPRQMMVLRFWNRMDLTQSSKDEITAWLEQFYNEDPRRKAAWEAFKLKNGDDGSQHDPSWVPIGAGKSYLNSLSTTDTG